jgi:two-component system, OmpR family, sensor histidine kinase CpxA
MFLKIFLSFWLTVALFAAAEEAASLVARNQEQRMLGEARDAVDAARTIPAAYDRGGASDARAAIDALRTERGLFADLLLADRTSVTGAAVRPAEIAAARLADRLAAAGYSQAAIDGAEGLAARQWLAAGGERLTLVVGLPRATTTVVVRALLISSPVRLLVILSIGGVVCFAVARHLSRPVIRLSAAATALAEGRLQTRVGPEAAKHHDELGVLARNFDQMADRLEALVAGQRRLLGDVSHELRSPLTRMRVALSLARRHGPGDASEYLDRVEREAGRLDRLIEQLLTLARIDSGVGELRAPFSLGAVVEEVVADGDFEARASNKRVTLVAGDRAVIVGMAELMRSAVENIVRNAIRHTPHGTSVDVTLRVETANAAHIVVRDHGPGVDPALVNEMFKPFWRTNRDGEPSDGAGLGLALAERVVAMHGGRLSASNAADGGLVMTIDLPAASPG